MFINLLVFLFTWNSLTCVIQVFTYCRTILFKDSSPLYEDPENVQRVPLQEHETDTHKAYEVIDLLADCRIEETNDSSAEPEYTEIQEMGLWHSTPLTQKKRHKSRISLTWVLKDKMEKTSSSLKSKFDDHYKHNVRKNLEIYEYQNERVRRCSRSIRNWNSCEVNERIVGRNEYQHELRFRRFREESADRHTYSDDTTTVTEARQKRHRYRHRRKKRRRSGTFGYDIKDLGSFLSEASIDRPGNIPVVIANPTTLYQTQMEIQRELPLPLGTVVNAVFKNRQWLYAQTPHGQEGYVLYGACMPLGILPDRTSNQKNTPCWESSTDIYPRPCGNLTDTEKENMRGRTRSECNYRSRRRNSSRNSCAESYFDGLYLRTKSVCSDLDKPDFLKRHRLL